MAKPIVLNEKFVDSMVDEFRKAILATKMSEGKVTYTKSFTYKDEAKVSVLFTSSAYVKMLSLLQHFDTEVGWHGTVERKADDVFVITDIVVYPQIVTGTTADTDQEEYQKWLISLDDDYFNSMHMQGHSHVMMGVSPSTTDTDHQKLLLQQLKGDSFYIFMVWNKRLDKHINIYDFATNTLYEDDDVICGVIGDGFDVDEFVAQAESRVTKKTYTYKSDYATETAYDKADKKADKKDDKKADKKSEGKKKGGSKGDKQEKLTLKEIEEDDDAPESYGSYSGSYGGAYNGMYGLYGGYNQRKSAVDYDKEIWGRRFNYD